MALLSPMSLAPVMTDACLIVCESANQWTVAFRSVLQQTGISVVHVETQEEMLRRVGGTIAPVVAVEVLPENMEATLGHVTRLRKDSTACGVIILQDERWRATEALWREAGAMHVVSTPRNLVPTARLIQRYLTMLEIPPVSFRDTVLRRLPWNGPWHPTDAFDSGRNDHGRRPIG